MQQINAKAQHSRSFRWATTQGRPYIAALCYLFFLMLLSACSGLGGEPRIVATIPVPTATTPAQPPLEHPDIAAGAAIFAEHCIACHGERGAANGALVRSGQIPAMRSFQEAAAAQGQRPTDWFSTITNGRIENMMPFWHEALTESERWNVALYTYTLHYDAEMLDLGRQVYAEFCASCHGDTGLGDGVDAATLREHPGDLTDPASMMVLSDNHLYVAVDEGAGEMPAFRDDLSEAEKRAVVAYSRSLALQNADTIGQQAQLPEPTAAPSAAADAASTQATLQIGTLSGTITNGTAGGSVPADMRVIVYRQDAEFNRTMFETVSDANGAFLIEGVPLDPQSNYVAAVSYRDRVFASVVRLGDTAALDLPITIYELTEDPAVIQISGMVTQINAVGSNLEVAQVINFVNTSDRAFTSSQLTDDGRAISLVLSLPPGAVIAGLSDPTRYIVVQDEYLVLDTFPVMPNEEHLVQLVYLVPYDAGGAIIEQRLNYAVEGPMRLLLAPASVRATSEQLPPRGNETIGSSVYQSYGDTLSLPAGSTLRYDISGAPAATAPTNASQSVSSDRLPLIILLIALAQIVILGGLYIFFMRRRSRMPTLTDAQLMDALIRQIAELDTEYEAGKIEKTVYERQRALLKERLAAVMERQA